MDTTGPIRGALYARAITEITIHVKISSLCDATYFNYCTESNLFSNIIYLKTTSMFSLRNLTKYFSALHSRTSRRWTRSFQICARTLNIYRFYLRCYYCMRKKGLHRIIVKFTVILCPAFVWTLILNTQMLMLVLRF